MARIRSIKPEFWTDGRIVKLPFEVRLFYIGLWNFADDWGVIEDDPQSLKLRIMPADDVDPVDLVEKLVADGRLTRKIAPDGSRVLVIRRWADHQRIDKRSPGRWGNPAEFSDAPPIPTNPSEDSAGRERDTVNPRVEPFSVDFDAWWDRYPRKVHRADAFRAYQARRREGISHERLDESRCHFKRAMNGTELRYVMHGSTFLAKDGPWSEYEHGIPAGEEPPATLEELATPREKPPWVCLIDNPECNEGYLDIDGQAFECACLNERARVNA